MQNTFASLAPQFVRRSFWLFLTLVLLATATSCIVDDDGDPKIISLTINPSQISRSETGTTKEFFTATIEVENFDDEITEAVVYIVSPFKEASSAPFEIEGNTIVLREIAKAWFANLEPGVYKIGARVTSDTVPKLQESNLTTVTITE